jgi:hypothetical protein
MFRIKYRLELQYGVWSGLRYQAIINNHFYWLAAGIKHFTILILMAKKEIVLVKDIFHAIQYL